MYIARNKDGKFVSGTNKPYRIGTFKFKNSDFHKSNDDRYDWRKPIDAIINEHIDEYDIIRYNGQHVIFDLGEDYEIGEIKKRLNVLNVGINVMRISMQQIT